MDSVAAPDELILEGIVVTVDDTGRPNIAPMGPRVDRDVTRLVLRPYQTSTTYRNLKQTGCGVFHVTDDVLLVARAAIGALHERPALQPVPGWACPRLADTCRWWGFRVERLDEQEERTTIFCQMMGSGEVRPFLGFNRAKHAVLEAAILATRVGILPPAEILSEMERLAIAVQKTAGMQERAAFDLVRDFLRARLAA